MISLFLTLIIFPSSLPLSFLPTAAPPLHENTFTLTFFLLIKTKRDIHSFGTVWR